MGTTRMAEPLSHDVAGHLYYSGPCTAPELQETLRCRPSTLYGALVRMERATIARRIGRPPQLWGLTSTGLRQWRDYDRATDEPHPKAREFAEADDG